VQVPRDEAIIEAAHAVPRSRNASGTDTKDLVKRLVAGDAPSEAATAPASSSARPSPTSSSKSAPTSQNDVPFAAVPFAAMPTSSGAVTKPIVASAAPLPASAERTGELEARTTPFLKPELEAHITPPITVAEAARTSVSVSDVVTVQHTDNTARVTAIPKTLITETPAAASVASTASASTAASTIENKPVVSEPSMLVADMHAVHVAATAAAQKSAAFAKPPADAATSSRELEISQTRRDAVQFSEDEEEFFKRAETHSVMHPKFESFEDLDDDYEPPKFWDRVFGRKKPKK
jgi:hypothetical protein